MKRYVPNYITDLRNTVHFLVFVSLYALIFIVVYHPFESTGWMAVGANIDKFVFYVILMVLIGMATLTISRMSLHFVAKRKAVSILNFMMWIFLEFAAIAFAVTLFTWLVTKKVNYNAYFTLYPRIYLITALILCIPYAIAHLYFALKNKEEEADALSAALASVQRPNLGGETGKAPEEVLPLMHFKDEKDELKLSVHPDALLYLEAADNYVKIHYLNKGEVCVFLLRNTLKNIEQLFTERQLIRCHRSYIINTQKIKILKKSKDGLFLELDEKNIPEIPVSKTYADNILQIFNKL
ncbi:MAG: LytTR family transcriptional regulator [Bacteroidales bacterium]|nr:LytTR family transcriptional regulator [Bacteroidales bacterium]